MQRIRQVANMIGNMGWRYILFRAKYAAEKKVGLKKRRFPVNSPFRQFLTLEEWKNNPPSFFFNATADLIIPVNPDVALREQAEKILEGKYLFFSSIEYDLGCDFDWITNPDTGFKYDFSQHWTDIDDYSKEAGDIKFVWEKSRFSFLYTLIRYDYHFKRDLSPFVFSQIDNWIDANRLNLGPNYKCSQEISLRLLNWTFALHYYKESATLTVDRFNKIINSIYWQAKHVYDNINFSKIAVRNNHAITETLTLYLIGLLYPFFPEASTWKKDGKEWFEKEIEYQLYPDGTFLQFSMNYHRVVIQLVTWGLGLAKANNETFGKVVYDRAEASLHFLLASMNEKDGRLPNYGANDGALFFPLNNNDFRDYRPQLEALSILLGETFEFGSFEDKYWYGLTGNDNVHFTPEGYPSVYSFDDGGYYLCKDKMSMTFIRCGNHKDRPSQADNLHIDIWANGENILRDAGSYKYNTDEETLRFFFGTSSHNTVLLGNYDQMQKGGRFIWYYWSGPASGKWVDKQEYFEFNGKVNVFKQVSKNIIHTRTVKKFKNVLRWEVIDQISSSINLPITQVWNPYDKFEELFNISSINEHGETLEPENKKGWYSGKYGVKEPTKQILFRSPGKYIHTTIEAKATNTNK